jgi:multiple sugar transport system ATP-binding protein
MSTLRLSGIAKRYGPVEIMRDIDLAVDDGEFVVLVGPSGCGKSTLLRMIAGLEEISAGDLFIGGRRANGLSPQARNISMVFQSYALFPHMTARGNIGFGPRIRHEPAAQTASKVGAAASILNLHAYLDRYPGQLSGGQRQRIAMGRTIGRDPEVFLFDEPLSNLDAKLRVQMRAEIKALHQKLHTTIVYVTHDQIEAMTMADRIVVMNHGVIEQTGTPLDLYDRPVNRFVAGFLGSPSMSFIDGRLEAGAGGPMLRTPEGIALPAPPGAALTDRPVVLGIRPEHYSLAADGEGVPVEVLVVEPTGAETHVLGRIGSAEVRCVFRERVAAAPGTLVHFNVERDRTHLFDAETGRRL